jgi:ectoine hydroxylase-related dioxygenase (phytanoyl-CoA dioxygenase family)
LNISGQIKEFQADGSTLLEDFYSTSRIEKCLEDMKVFCSDVEKGTVEPADVDIVVEKLSDGREGIKYLENLDIYVPSFRKLASSKLLGVASQMLGEETYVQMIEYHNKMPGGGTFTPPHQDNFYFCFNPASALTAYVPLEDHGPENGYLQHIPGSHIGETRDHVRSKVAAFSSYIELSEAEKETLRKNQLKPGVCRFHHINLIHSADENKSARHRRACSVRVIGMSAKLDPGMKKNYGANYLYNRGHAIKAPSGN